MNLKKLIAGTLGLAVVGFALNNCGGTTAATSTVTISGTLATTASRAMDLQEADQRATYKVRCVTLSGTPESGEGEVDDTTHKFSLQIASAAGVPLGCFVLSGTTIVATVAFKGSTTGLDGTTTNEGTYVSGSGGDLEFGTVTLDLSTGTATVVKADVTGSAAGGSTTVVPGTFASMTGTWAVSNCIVPSTGLACPEGHRDGGPPSSLFFHQMGPITDADAKTHYGFAVWQDATMYAACGSTEGIPTGQLPTGWTTSDASLTTPLTPYSLDLMNFKAQSFGGGKTACGATYAGPSMTCNEIAANTDHWQNGHGFDFSVADCKAICVMSAHNDDSSGGSCRREIERDWSKQQAALSAGQLACTGSGCGSGPAAGAVTLRDDRPQGRFVANELIINGTVGTVVDKKDHAEHACIGTPGSSCTNIDCRINEKVTINIQQASATSAVISVTMKNDVYGMNSTTTAQCLNNDSKTNHIAQKASENQAFVFTATKTSR